MGRIYRVATHPRKGRPEALQRPLWLMVASMNAGAKRIRCPGAETRGPMVKKWEILIGGLEHDLYFSNQWDNIWVNMGLCLT